MEKRNKTCCFTGHRPEVFTRSGEGPETEKIKHWLDEKVDAAIKAGFKRFICGNALGVDTWAALTVLKKKEIYGDIFLEIAVPFEGHNKGEPETEYVNSRADLVHVVTSEKSHAAAYAARNRYMVDNSDLVIAVYDDSSGISGGTKKTVGYTRKKGTEVIQCQWRSL